MSRSTRVASVRGDSYIMEATMESSCRGTDSFSERPKGQPLTPVLWRLM